MTDDSFTYNAIDMYKLYKMRIVSYDLLLPSLREHKQKIQKRSGSYNYAPTLRKQYHDERELIFECVIDGSLTSSQLDDLKYTLSKRGNIILWDKQDRYYTGQCYNPGVVDDYFDHCMRTFDLAFTCDPYAYDISPVDIKTSQATLNLEEYKGNRHTPTRIKITNNGTRPVSNFIITTRAKNA